MCGLLISSTSPLFRSCRRAAWEPGRAPVCTNRRERLVRNKGSTDARRLPAEEGHYQVEAEPLIPLEKGRMGQESQQPAEGALASTGHA
jgi:hypothetical protein